MGTQERARIARIEAWLAEGGAVLAATERSARSVTAAFHTARRAEGLKAWRTPSIFPWEGWVLERWRERDSTGLVLLNLLQEQALWMRVIEKSRAGESLLHPGRLATAAQQAYRLLCGYAPKALKPQARTGWSGDAAIFSEWVDAFESHCRREELISNSRLPVELAEAFLSESAASNRVETRRQPLLLIGFDRLLNTQESLLDAWGEWRQDEPGAAAQSSRFLAAPDAATEVEACVNWLRRKLRANPEARLMVITTALQENRGELERALLDTFRPDDEALDFEFSLGIPLGQVSLARSALLLLRWLHEALTEPELDWLLGSGHCSASSEEEIALAETMRELRRQGKERPEWELDDFALASKSNDSEHDGSVGQATWVKVGANAWIDRLFAARDQLLALPARQNPLEWTGIAVRLLDAVGWPGFRSLSSIAFQAQQRWERVLEECGSLGFDGTVMGGEIEWAEFVSTVAEAVSGTIFATESSDARVQITEPLESAGQLADGIWFLGAHEENWPGRGQPHPLLPVGFQREMGMPHASPLADWKLAQEATARLLASADEVVFSYAKQMGEVEARPSRLVSQYVSAAEDLPGGTASAENTDRTEIFEDLSVIPFPHAEMSGGAATLTRQSLCPFQAFATARLNAEHWEAAEAGLTPKQRGQLLHSVLRKVWAGSAQGGISSLDELQRIPDLPRFVGGIVASVMVESFNPNRRNSLPARFPSRYLKLEAERLTLLVSEWLEYERERLPFTVTGTEVKSEAAVAGLTLKLRLDRVDELQNGGKLVIDYKSSEVGPKAWAGERPDDVQLPLYAAFAIRDHLEGLVFARIRPDTTKFYGRVHNATSSLLPDLNKRSRLVNDPLTDRQLEEWRQRIESLGEDFLAGRSNVDPKDPVKICEKCHLHAVCRIYENQPLAAAFVDGDEDAEESEDQEGSGGGDA
jgi:ATP-dependent helicase/nuclease subunit B